MNTQKIIIDTDPGKDDILAILLAFQSKKLSIQAVTTVAGNTSIQNVTNNARYILDVIQSACPLYSGAQKPLRGRLEQGKVMGKTGLVGVDVTIHEPLNDMAVEKIIEIVRANPGEITILAIGPLTNLAKACMRDPEIPKLLRSIVMMGGSMSLGNTNRVAEFNFYTDAQAASIIFQSEAKKVLIPLDVCYTVPLTTDDFSRLKGSQYFPIIWTLMESYIEYLSRFEGQKGAIVYDALAAYYLLNPSAFRTEEMDIQIETTGKLTRGMCVIEKRSYVVAKSNVTVATSIQREEFRKDFLDILKNQ